MSIVLIVALCFQFVTPIITVAVTIDGNGEVSLNNVEMESGSTKEATKIKLTLKAITSQSHESVINVSNNFLLTASGSQELVDGLGNNCGTYQVIGNEIHLSVLPNVSSDLVAYIEGSTSVDIQDPRVLFNYGETSKELVLPHEWVEMSPTEESSLPAASETQSSTTPETTVSQSASTSDSTQESSISQSSSTAETSSTESSTAIQKQQAFRTAMNIADIYTSLGLSDDFLTAMNLTFEDANGNPVIEPTVNDIINFGFSFSLLEEVRQEMQAGDYYTIQLPNTVKMLQVQTFPLKDLNGIEYATVTIDMNGLVKITFTDEVENASEIKGDFSFTGTFNRITIGEPGLTIIIPASHEHLQVEVNIKPNYTGNNIAKAGHFDHVQNPGKIIWNVDINMGMDVLSNAQVSEIFPVGTTFESVKVYQMQVDFSGNIIANSGTLVDQNNYNIAGNGTVSFNHPISNTYRIEYTTTISDQKKPASGGQVPFLNKATLQSDNVQPATAQATVVAKYGKEITKVKGNYDSTKQIINWTLNYNYGEKTITDGIITDTFQNANMTLVNGSLKLYAVTFTNSGTAIKGSQLIEGTDYQIVSNATGFEIDFLHLIQSAVLINYQTGYNGIVDSTIPIGNTVETASGQTSGGTGSFVQQNIIKRLGNVDYNLQTVSWNISVNINQYTMNNWQFTDTESEGLSLQTSTFKIYDQNTQQFLVAGQDYSFGYNPLTRITTVSFINGYVQTNHAFKITYTDDYHPESNPSPDLNFVNKAHVEWVSTAGQTIIGDDSQTFFPNSPTRYNGSKSGAYNAINKQITWTLAIDYRDTILQNGKIVDKLAAGQTYIPGSIKIYNYTIATNGDIIKGSEITPTQYQNVGIQEPSVGNNQTLIIDIPNNVYGKYLAEFRTSLENQLIHKTYTNDAVFSNDNYQSYNLHAEVTVNHGDELVTKGGVQDTNGFVQWNATINGEQATLYEPTIIDTPSPNQAIDLNSLKLFSTTVDQSGNLAKAGQLVFGQDYTVNLTTNNTTGQQLMTIKLINGYLTLRRAIMLSYQSMVFLETNSGIITNQLDLNSTGTTQTVGGRTTSVDVVSGSGGGSASGVRGLVNIRKVDELGHNLPLGGTFELLDKNGNQVLRSGTVDANGLISFGALPYGSYMLKETNTLTNLGYTISPALATGIPVEISAATTQGTPIVIQNKLGVVKLTKVNEQGQPLSGAKFQLEKYDGITDTWSITGTNQSLVTISDGTVTINGLNPGKYRLTEMEAPHNYIMNNTPLVFDVVVNELNQLVPVGLPATVTNYVASIQLNKTDEQGSVLQGSIFNLFKQGDSSTILATATSNALGEVLFEKIGPGNYEIREQSSTTGFLINTQTIDAITIPAIATAPIGKINIVTPFVNYQGSVSLTKYGNNSAGRAPLNGVQFNLENEQGQVVKTGVTDMDGKLTFGDLAPGKYYFSEQSLGSNTQYILNSQKVEAIVGTSASGEPAAVKVEMDNYQGIVRFKKVNSSGTALVGAKFTLYNKADDSIVQAGLISDSNGIISQANLAPGEYYLKETEAPLDSEGKAYVINTTPINFTIATSVSGEPEVIDLQSFPNYQGSVSLVKYGNNATGRNPLNGVQFNLENEQGQVVRTGMADTSGKLTFTDLTPGKYYFSEQNLGVNTQYILNSQKVEAIVGASASGEPAVVQVEMDNYQGAIRLKKVNSIGTVLEGAKFTLYRKSDDSIVQAGLTSDADGIISQVNLAPGDYYLQETQAPVDGDGNSYILNTSPINFTIATSLSGEPEVLNLESFVNYQGSVKITKYGNNSTGRIPLTGVQFNLENEQGQVVKTGMTDTNGMLQFDDLTPGKYYFSEQNLGSNTQYILNSQKVEAIVETSASGEPAVVQVELDNYQGAIRLKKVNSVSNPLAGAEFSLYNKLDDSLVKAGITSGADGLILQADLAPGSYYLKESKAPVGSDGEAYIINDFPLNFTIAAAYSGKPETLDLQEFQNFKGKIGLTKVGIGELPIAGAKFELYQAEGSKEVLVTVNGQNFIEADADGILAIDELEPGAYKLVEIDAPKGYIINLQPVYFTIKADESGLPPVEAFTIVNYEMGIKARKISDKNKLLPEFLANATFEIRDVNNQPVQVYDGENNPVFSFSSDNNGELEVTGLEEGSYTLVETSAPVGFVKNTGGIPFEIKAVVGAPQHLVLDLGNIVNYQGKIQIQKLGEGKQPLNGGQFELRDVAGEAVEVVNRAGLATKQLAAVDGEIFATGIPPGSYYLVETVAPDGYVLELDNQVLPVIINQEGSGVSGATFIGEFTNYQGSVLLNKISEKAQKPLAKAVFDLYTQEDKLVKSSLVTDEKGKVEVIGLTPGEYYFIEKEAPTGYELSKGKYSFSIEESSVGKPEQVVVTISNKEKNKEPVTPEESEKPREPGKPRQVEGTLGKFGEQIRNGFVIGGMVIVVGVMSYILFWKKKKK